MSEFQVMTGPKPVKLTVDDYELLLKSGALDGYQHVELIEGVIVEMNAERTRHTKAKMAVTFRLNDALRALGSNLEVRCEPTIRLSPHSLPEPDVIIVDPEGDLDDYPSGASVKLVVEVADSSRLSDLRYKYELYGDYSLPEYWVVDLPEQTIHLFWEPIANGYRKSRKVTIGQDLSSETVPGLTINTADLY